MTKKILFSVFTISNVILCSYAQELKVDSDVSLAAVEAGSSFVFGNNSTATPSTSYVFGEGLQAKTFSEMVLGRYNNLGIYTGASTTAWQNTDSVFVIGIGKDNNTRANAFEVYKSGKISIPKRQGDIFMGEFGKPEDRGNAQ
jgi:hypothetical protein